MPTCSSHQNQKVHTKNSKSVAIFQLQKENCAFPPEVLPPEEFHTVSLALKVKEGQQIPLQNHNPMQHYYIGGKKAD